MLIFIKSILFLFYFCVKDVKCSDCYWNNQCKYTFFSSKTPYEIVRGDIRDSVANLNGCEAISVWVYLRHGKRNPGRRFGKQMEYILEYREHILYNYEKRNSTICAQDVENLRKWSSNNVMLNKPSELNAEGHQEMVGIASRLMETFPDLLSDLREDEYLFHPLFGKRMTDSAKAFIEGLNNQSLIIGDEIYDYDDKAPHATCGKYQKEVIMNNSIYEEVQKYQLNPEFVDSKERIERKLGVKTTYENVTALYDLCRYFWDGIANKPSPWCALFTTKDLEVFEYIGDLEHYYRNGYGTKYSRVLGEIVLADVLRNFEEAKEQKGKKIISSFGHATVIDMILVALDLFKDKIPLTGVYRDLDRKWKATRLSTFAGNIIAVLNRCKDAGDGQDYKIAFYLNEEPLLELCEQGVCSWQQFENKFRPFLNATEDFCEFRTKPK